MEKTEKILLDLQGVSCPLPIIQIKKALGSLSVGTVLEVHATDKGLQKDLAVLSEKYQYKTTLVSEDPHHFVFHIEKTI